MRDSLIKCKHCGSNFCYSVLEKDIVSWSCMECGYHSNSYLINESEQVVGFESSMPELLKDIRYVDDNNFVWYPQIINKSDKGIIFPDGRNQYDWTWCFAPAKLIPLQEQYKFPDPSNKGQFMTHKIDMSNKKLFGRTEFTKALIEAKFI